MQDYKNALLQLKWINEKIKLTEGILRQITLSEPYIKGHIHYNYVKCGRKGCRCASGKRSDRHGPYAELRWEEDGIKHSRYIKKKELEQYKTALSKQKKVKTLEQDIKQLRKLRRDILNKT